MSPLGPVLVTQHNTKHNQTKTHEEE